MFVSVTRLRVRSWRFLIPFLRRSRASIKQAVTAKGFHTGSTLLDRRLTFWTLTVWDSEDDMKEYRGGGPHREAMRYLRGWCSEAATAHWNQSGPQRPSWDEAWERLRADAKWHVVDHPAPEYVEKHIAPPAGAKWRDQPMR